VAITYYPIREDNEKYERIYAHYLRISEYFRRDNNIMKFLSENK
jgi:hypothetical protein